MSKCYVIKNKFDDNFELNCCTIYPTKRDAELTISLHQLKNCEVVECTICEGDIVKDNRVLRKMIDIIIEDFLNVSQELVENGIIEGSIATDVGFDIAKKKIYDEARSVAEKEVK